MDAEVVGEPRVLTPLTITDGTGRVRVVAEMAHVVALAARVAALEKVVGLLGSGLNQIRDAVLLNRRILRALPQGLDVPVMLGEPCVLTPPTDSDRLCELEARVEELVGGVERLAACVEKLTSRSGSKVHVPASARDISDQDLHDLFENFTAQAVEAFSGRIGEIELRLAKIEAFLTVLVRAGKLSVSGIRPSGRVRSPRSVSRIRPGRRGR